jgi:hypothetical protein
MHSIGKFCVFIILLAIGLFPQQSFTREIGSFNGDWEGKLKVVATSVPTDSVIHNDHVAPYNAHLFKIIIRNKDVRVFADNDEIKQGHFGIYQHKANAVVCATNSGIGHYNKKDGAWVETWCFLLTQKDQNTLIGNFSRLVNHTDLPADDEYATFSINATGEFRRVPK